MQMILLKKKVSTWCRVYATYHINTANLYLILKQHVLEVLHSLGKIKLIIEKPAEKISKWNHRRWKT